MKDARYWWRSTGLILPQRMYGRWPAAIYVQKKLRRRSVIVLTFFIEMPLISQC